jgi:putative oxidoreductase
METGWGKLTDIGKVIGFFTDLGIPAPAFNAYFVSTLEFGGGVLLTLGLGSRLIAVPLVIDMLVAYITAIVKRCSLRIPTSSRPRRRILFWWCL